MILASSGLVATFKGLALSTATEICGVLRNPGLGMLYSILALRKLKKI
jgi:hypothetical protein